MSFAFDSRISQSPPPKHPARTRRSHGRRRALEPLGKCFDGRSRKQSRNGRKATTSSSSSSSSKGVAEKLEALRKLIPTATTSEATEISTAVSPDHLFDEAVDYILLLKTQVEILKHLVNLYSPTEDNATVSSW